MGNSHVSLSQLLEKRSARRSKYCLEKAQTNRRAGKGADSGIQKLAKGEEGKLRLAAKKSAGLGASSPRYGFAAKLAECKKRASQRKRERQAGLQAPKILTHARNERTARIKPSADGVFPRDSPKN